MNTYKLDDLIQALKGNEFNISVNIDISFDDSEYHVFFNLKHKKTERLELIFTREFSANKSLIYQGVSWNITNIEIISDDPSEDVENKLIDILLELDEIKHYDYETNFKTAHLHNEMLRRGF